MITINIYGLDQFVVGELSARISRDIAKLYEVDEDEINYLTSRGISEEDAESMIVRGFLNMDITGLPDELAEQTQRMIDMSLDGM